MKVHEVLKKYVISDKEVISDANRIIAFLMDFCTEQKNKMKFIAILRQENIVKKLANSRDRGTEANTLKNQLISTEIFNQEMVARAILTVIIALGENPSILKTTVILSNSTNWLSSINADYNGGLLRIDEIKQSIETELSASPAELSKFAQIYAELHEPNQKLFLLMLHIKGCELKDDSHALIYYKCEDKDDFIFDAKREVVFSAKTEQEIVDFFKNRLGFSANVKAQMQMLAKFLLELAIDKLQIKCRDKAKLIAECRQKVEV